MPRPSILIIGNGPSADTPATEPVVHRAELVMRINNWQPSLHTGDRCDIWGTSYNVDVPARYAKEIWWTAWPYSGGDCPYEPILAAQGKPYTRVCPKEVADRALAFITPHPDGRPRNASTGLILAFMAKAFGYDITLVGFDHFRAKRHHYWQRKARTNPLIYHSPSDEARAFASLKPLRHRMGDGAEIAARN